MIKALVSFLFSILLGSSLYASERTQIFIKSEVEVSNQSQLKLIDIAEVQAGGFLLIQALSKFNLPPQDKFETIELAKFFKQAFRAMPDGTLAQEPQLILPSSLSIKKVDGISQKHIQRLMVSHLETLCANCEFNIQWNQIPRVASPHFEFDFSNITLKGSFTLPIKEEGAISPLWITGRVQIKKEVPVAARLLLSNERLQATDLKMEFVDVTWAKDSAPSFKDLLGQTVNKTIPVGAPVWNADLRKEMFVTKGQLVKAIVQGDNSDFEISTQMTALDGGLIGDLVKMKDQTTKKEFVGVVIEKGIVRIQ